MIRLIGLSSAAFSLISHLQRRVADGTQIQKT